MSDLAEPIYEGELVESSVGKVGAIEVMCAAHLTESKRNEILRTLRKGVSLKTALVKNNVPAKLAKDLTTLYELDPGAKSKWGKFARLAQKASADFQADVEARLAERASSGTNMKETMAWLERRDDDWAPKRGPQTVVNVGFQQNLSQARQELEVPGD